MRRTTKSILATALTLGLAGASVFALGAAGAAAQPTGISTVVGTTDNGVFDGGATVTLTQSSAVAVVEVASFDISPIDLFEIITPSADSITVIRSLDAGVADISGRVTSTGTLIILTPNGLDLGLADASITAAGDLIVAAGSAPNSEFSPLEPVVDIAIAAGAVPIAIDGDVTAGGSVAVGGVTVTNFGSVVAQNGDAVLYAGTGIEYLVPERTIDPVGSAVAGGYVDNAGEVSATAGAAGVAAFAPGEVALAGEVHSDGVGDSDNPATVVAAGSIFGEELPDVAAVVNGADPVGSTVGVRLFEGDTTPFALSSVTMATAGEVVPESSVFIASGLTLYDRFVTSVIQSRCVVEEGEITVDMAFGIPEVDGTDLVTVDYEFSVPNQPGIVVPDFGTVYFNEQSTSTVGGYDILSVTALRIVTPEGEIRVGMFDCGMLAAPQLAATGADSRSLVGLGALGMLALLAGIGLAATRRRAA